MVASTLTGLIQSYFYLLFIGAAVVWFLLRPIADAFLKLAAFILMIIGIYGMVLFILQFV